MNKYFRVAILIALTFTAKGTFAAGTNWYVLKGATGANNGTSWTNAWNEMNQINCWSGCLRGYDLARGRDLRTDHVCQ